MIEVKKENINMPISALNLFSGYVYSISKEDVITFCNDRYARLLGASSSSEVIGKVAITLESSLGEFREETKLIIEKDLEFIVQRTENQSESKALARDEMGNISTFICQRFMEYDANGKVVGMLGMILKESEVDEMNQLNLLETIIAFIPGTVYWIDKDGVYIGCNEACPKMLGLDKKADVLGKTIFEIGDMMGWDKSIAKSLSEKDKHVLQTGESVLGLEETPFTDMEGKTIYQITNKAPIRDASGEIIGVIGNSIDITKQKDLEKILINAKEKAESLDKAEHDFIMNIQHDIRTPFNGIYQGVQIIKEIIESMDVSEELISIIDAILLSVKRILSYCEGIIQSGELLVKGITLHEKKFNVAHLVQEMVEMQGVSTQLNKIEVKYEFYQSTPVAVIGDAFMLKRLLTTVLSNSIKFTKEGSIHLVVKKIKELNGREVVIRFQIADTGIGISDKDQESIFEMFSKVHPSNTERYKGNGLGLYLAKKMVNEVGGDIDFFSKLGEGTTVRFDIPFKLPLDEDCLEQNDPT